MYRKRLWVCVLGGMISAVICLAGYQVIFGFPQVTLANVAGTVANRLLLGFAIGFSGWRIHHLFHGGVLGLLFSLSVSIGFLSSNLLGFFLYTIAGVLYGIFIEWLSTDVFKAPMKAS